ncbi:hypothetical protein WMF23_34530 [Sorangium sp. So ce542]
MVARFPEHENCWPRRSRMLRAAQVVIVPLSVVMIASSVRNEFSAAATTWGLSGTSGCDSRSRISSHHSRIRIWANSRNERSSCRARSGSSARSVSLASPASPTSTA